MITAVVLADDTRGLSSVIKWRDGIAFQGLDVAGAVRAVSEPVARRDGTWDTTEFADTAAVTLSLQLYGSFRSILDELAQYCAPYARPYLKVSDDEWTGDRVLKLRYDSGSGPVGLGTGRTRKVALSWKVPSGGWEAATATEYWIPASAAATTGLILTSASGLSIPTTGLDMPASNATADSLVSVDGSLRPSWTARLYGPCTAPALYRDDTGEAVVFGTGLSLTAGQYVELNSADRSAYLNSDTSAGRLLYLDYASTTWFDLEPGTCKIRYAPQAVSAGSECWLSFTPVWMPV